MSTIVLPSGSTKLASPQAVFKFTSIGTNKIQQIAGAEQLFDYFLQDDLIVSGSTTLHGPIIDKNGSSGTTGQVPIAQAASFSTPAGWSWGTVSSGGGGAVSTYTDTGASRVITSTGGSGIKGNNNLKFAGSLLTLTGRLNATGDITGSSMLLSSQLRFNNSSTRLEEGGGNRVRITPGIEINDSNTIITEAASGDSVRIITPSGHVEIGPKNSGFSHFYTSMDKYYFDHQIVVDEGIVASYDEDLSLRRANSTNDSINIAATQINFYLDGNEDMRLENDGDLHLVGDAIAFSTTISDSRLKDNIIQIGGALDKIKSLRGVSYTWNSGHKKDKQDIGLIAQEVEKILPEIVTEKKMPLMTGADPNINYKTIDYEKIIPVLIEAIKEQQNEIDELRKKIESR
jgi:hypothetical protein